MLGLPLYNFEECIKYIISGLKRSGFFIQRLPDPNINIIYIYMESVILNQNFNTGDFSSWSFIDGDMI